MTWMQTRSGAAVDLLDPAPGKISIADIAWSLARACRFTGHCSAHYSVAEHSILASQIVPPEHAMAALLHDAAEAYVGDASWPLKDAMRRLSPGGRSPYDEVERRVWLAVARRFSLPDRLPDAVRAADDMMLVAERAELMVVGERDWQLDGIAAADVEIRCFAADIAERMFLQRFRELRGPEGA